MTPATRDAGSTEPWRYLVLNVTVTLACDNTQRVQQLTNMPRTQQQQQSSGGRHSGRQGAGRGRSAHGQQATQRTMCGSEWARVNGRVNLMPDVLSQGLPPQPWDRLPDSSASYVDRWKKLCFLEFHASLFEFCAELQAPQGRRPQRPRLSVTLERSGPLEQTGRKPPLGCWVVTIESRGDGADAEVSVSDLPHALIHLEGEGWFYVQNLEQQDLPGRFPVRADGYLYSDGFQRAPGAHGSSWSCAQIFESFLTFRYRFKALSTYMGVGADVRRALEQPGPLPAAAALQLVPLQQGQVSKLNAGQRAILQRLRWPVDFVQGPPGMLSKLEDLKTLRLMSSSQFNHGEHMRTRRNTATHAETLRSPVVQFRCAAHREVRPHLHLLGAGVSSNRRCCCGNRLYLGGETLTPPGPLTKPGQSNRS